ncbi:MAG TPA: hypothetical protein VJ464_26075 [Blastocatellia bacterium]|nr:hypothetical protein [Blastocatellia bacterium]
MRKLLSAGVISLTLLAGSTFAFAGQRWDRDRDDHHRRVTVVRTTVDNDGYHRHARVFRMRNGRVVRMRDGRVMVITRRHPRYYRYYDRQHRIP